MLLIREWFSRILGAFRGGRSDHDLEAELRSHLEMSSDEARRRAGGSEAVPPPSSMRAAGLAQAMDALRDQRSVPWLDDVVQDVRYACRGMVRNRGFAATALITLAVGVAMTATVFSVVDNVLLKPLPFPAADRLVRVWEEHPGGTPITNDRWLSNRTFWAWLDHPRTIDVLGGFGTYEYTVAIDDDSVRMFGAEGSPQLLGAVGAKVVAGRLFSDEEAEQGADRGRAGR